MVSKTEMMVALGAAIGANCIPCFDYLYACYRETGRVLGISPGNVKVRLHRARKKMKAILEQRCRFDYGERNVMVCEPVGHGRHGPAKPGR